MKHAGKRVVFLTGAGISAESGIKTFRASDGLWNGHRIEDVASPVGWRKDPVTVLDFYNKRRVEVIGGRPNPGHRACAELEDAFDVTIITQNIDDLHERAGSSRVLHIHGEILKGQSSIAPEVVFPLSDPIVKIGDLAPDGSQVRPHVVWFGEAVLRMDEAIEAVQRADAFVVCGTALAVYPAAGLAELARPGTPCYLVDPNPPGVRGDGWTVLAESASIGLPKLAEMLRRKMRTHNTGAGRSF